MKIALVRFNSSSMTPKMKTYPDLYTIDLEVYIKDERVTNVDNKTLFEKCEKIGENPKTTQPTTGTILKMMTKLSSEYDKIIISSPSLTLSGTHQNVLLVYKDFSEEIKKKFIIQETNSIVISESIVLDYAIDLINEGVEIEKLPKLLEEYSSKVVTYIVVGDLKYLKKSGRVSLSKALLGQMLNMRILIKSVAPETGVYKKGRGFKSILKELVNDIDQTEFDKMYLTSVLRNDKEYDLVKKKFENSEVVDTGESNTIIASHFGPGCFGVAIVKK